MLPYHALLFQLQNGTDHIVIDANEDNGSYGRLINHSKRHPNVKPVPHKERGNFKTILFLAMADIDAGEELLFNYGEMYHAGIFDCVEGCSKCR